MKRLLLLCTSLLCAISLNAQNILKNPDFKALNAQGRPLHWSFFDKVSFEVNGPDGAVLAIAKEGGNATVTQSLRPEPSLPYVLSFSCRSDSNAICQTYVEWNFPQGEELIHHNSGAARFATTGTWTAHKQYFTVPDNYRNCYLALRSPEGGFISFKDLVVRPVKIRKDATLGGYWNLEQLKNYTDTAIVLAGDEKATVNAIPVEPGKRYRLSYDACGAGAVDPAYPFHEIKTQVTPAVQGAFAFNDVSNSTQRKFQVFTIPAKATFRKINITFSIRANAKASVSFSNFKLEEYVPDPKDSWQFVLDEPFYRDTIYASQKIDTIQASLTTNAPAVSYKVTFEGKSQEGKTNANTRIYIPAKDLTEGSHPLTCTVYDAQGKELKTFTRRIQKVAPSPVEIIGMPNRFFSINGKPFHPVTIWTLREWSDKFLYYAARHGVNSTMTSLGKNEEEFLKKLDLAQKYGIKCIVHSGYTESNPAAKAAFLAKLQKRFPPSVRKHPAFFGYFITDEPLWGGKSYVPLQETFELMRSFDPYHPTWINAAPRNEVADLRPYGEACDIWGCDIYPIPQPNSHSGLEDKTITSVGKYCLRMDETTWHRKPIWMALQGFGWGENPECGPLGRSKTHPTLAQMRYMAFDACLNGCTGYGLWGTNYVKDANFAEIIFQATAEVYQYSGLYLDGKPLAPAKSSNEAIRAQVLDYKGDLYYFIMNLTNADAKGTVAINAKAQKVLASDGASADFATGTITMKPYGFLVCATAPLPKPAFELIPKNPELEAEGSPIAHIIEKQLEEIMNRKTFMTKANWIWDASSVKIASNTCFIAKTFNAKPGQKVLFRIAVDDYSKVFLNGKEIGDTEDWDKLFDFDLSKYVKAGENTLVIRAGDAGGLPCGLLGELHIGEQTILTDTTWLASPAKDSKAALPASLKEFVPAIIVAPYGSGAWRNNVCEQKK